MRVTQFIPFEEDAIGLGLAEIEMRRLGHVVVLAGPNGAGKTRLLSLLHKSLTALRDQQATPSSELESVAEHLKKQIADPHQSGAWLRNMRGTENANRRVIALRKDLKISPAQHGLIVTAIFNPDVRGFGDPQQANLSQLQQAYETASRDLGTATLKTSALAYMSHIASRFFGIQLTRTLRPPKVNAKLLARTGKPSSPWLRLCFLELPAVLRWSVSQPNVCLRRPSLPLDLMIPKALKYARLYSTLVRVPGYGFLTMVLGGAAYLLHSAEAILNNLGPTEMSA
jgi:hypothetical protein